jgi:hypothetical protein
MFSSVRSNNVCLRLRMSCVVEGSMSRSSSDVVEVVVSGEDTTSLSAEEGPDSLVTALADVSRVRNANPAVVIGDLLSWPLF